MDMNISPQGYGQPLWLLHGMFKANGGCGYVKKPDILLNDNPDQLYDPKATLLPMKTLKVNFDHILLLYLNSYFTFVTFILT